MLHIHHEESDQTPTKAYADACWAENPRLSPDWWRELLGQTLGKIALDWRKTIANTSCLSSGCNLVLATPQTWPQVLLHLTPAVVSVLVTDNLAQVTQPFPTWLVYQGEERNALTQLETWVKEGQLEAYGIVLGSKPLHLWLEAAAYAAQTVWGRKKRPALKIVLASMDLLDRALLHDLTTFHKDEPVSALELAARLSLAVIVTPSVLPQEKEPSTEVLQTLTQAAQAEHALHEHLEGWPTLQNQQLFSLLAPLSLGQAPWPTPQHWQGWKIHLWPQLQTQWQSLDNSQNTILITGYLRALQSLLPYGEELSATAAQPLLTHILNTLAPRLPHAWQLQEPLAQNLALLTSIPGIGVVAVAQAFNPSPLQQLGGISDIAPLLM